MTVTWGDDSGLNANSREIKLNGVLVTDSFSYSGSTVNATSQGTVTLQAGENSVTASICDTASPSKCTSQNAIYTYEPPPAPAPYTKPTVSVAPMAQNVRRPGLCAVDCFEPVVAYATPAYVSLDAERAVTLVHRGGQGAMRRVLVEVDAIDNSANVPQKMSIKVRRPDETWVTFTNGNQEIFYQSGNGTSRLAAQFDPGSLATGSYEYRVVVRTWWSNGETREQAPVPFRFIVINERGSRFGAGWTMAGLQRIHIQSDGILLTEGDGSAVFFTKTGTNAWSGPAGEFTTLTYETSNSRYTRTYPDRTVAVFNSSGQLLYAEDRFGNRTSYAYSPSGRMQKITDPIGKTIDLTYDSSGRLTTITDPAGRQTKFRMSNGYLTEITDPDGVRAFLFSWGNANRLRSYTDRRGGVWNITYDAHSKLATLTAPEIPLFGSNDPTRPMTRFRSREMGLLPSASNGTSSLPAPRVLPDNVQARVTDARSNHTDLTLNRFGAPTFIKRPLNDTTRLDWDPQGRLRGVRQANGHNVEYNWHGGKLTRIHDTSTEAITTITYDTAFNQVEEASVGGVTVTNRLGPYGEVLESKIGAQPATTFTYDSRYRVKTITDPEGLKTENVYQSGDFQNTGNVTLSKSGMTTRTTTFTYDAYGRVTSVTDPASNVSKVQYDLLNRPTKTTDPRNFETTFNYGANNVDLHRATDAKGQVYTYNRNALGWVQSEVDPANRQIAYQYDANGNLMLKENRRNQLIVFDYDALNRIWKRSADSVLSWWSYDNPLNRSMVVENDVSRDEIYYDKAGRVTNQITIRAGRRYHLSSHYRKEGPRDTLRMIEPWPRMVAYNYNNALQLNSLRDLTGGTTTLSYNDTGLPTRIRLPTNTPRLTQLLAYTPSEALASSRYRSDLFTPEYGRVDYGRDNLDRIVWRGDTISPPPFERSYRQFTYDKNSQLTAYFDRKTTWQEVCPSPDTDCHWESSTATIQQDSYSYDPVGNRTDRGAVQAGNRLVSFDGWTLEYDADGNLTRKAKSGQPTQRFEWNSLGQLTKVTVGSVVTTYKYDGLGRWARRTSTSDTLDFIYDDQNLFMIVEGDTLRREFTHYPGLDRLHSQRNWIGENGVTYYYAQDDPGHVIGLFNARKQAVNRYSYDPWGVAQQKVEDVNNPLQFMGRFRDFHTGLYQVRARWYDPQVGRFISEDPIGLQTGYVFAGNDPVNKRDPSGLQECWWEYEANVSESGASELIATRRCSEAGGGGGGRSSGWNPHPSDRGSNPPRGGPDGSEWGGVGGGPSSPPGPDKPDFAPPTACFASVGVAALATASDLAVFTGVGMAVRSVMVARGLAATAGIATEYGVQRATVMGLIGSARASTRLVNYQAAGAAAAWSGRFLEQPFFGAGLSPIDLIPGIHAFKNISKAYSVCRGAFRR